jgi:hypothetical protein
VTLESRIESLDDATAEQLLQRFAAAQPAEDRPGTLDSSLADQFAALLGVTASPDASAGALARAALTLLARDPAHRSGIAALVESPAPQRYVVVETTLLVSAVLIALQTHLRFERDKDGKWSIKIEKKPTESSLLKDLVRKLLSFR